jgi:enoyl-CoA hydratase/carnithine racemase
MSELVLYEQEGPVALLSLNRPELRNPISEADMVDALVSALERLNADLTVRVAILTGRGSAFSSGGNLRHMGAAASSRPPVETNGPAIGAGCDLACMCDIRIAAESARFAESFVKVGIIPGDGGAWLLQRVVGYSKAAEMAFTGDTLDAPAALECGLVSKVVPDAELLATARELAGRIAANPPHVLRMTKRLLQEARHARLDSVLQLSAAMQSLAHATKDHAEAVDAMLNKRKPSFTGE